MIQCAHTNIIMCTWFPAVYPRPYRQQHHFLSSKLGAACLTAPGHDTLCHKRTPRLGCIGVEEGAQQDGKGKRWQYNSKRDEQAVLDLGW